MEHHSLWVKELYDQGHDYRFQFVASTSELDVSTAEPSTSSMARFLLVFVYAEKGELSVALKYLKEAKQQGDKAETKGYKDGYDYLIAGLEKFVSKKQGTAAPSLAAIPFGNLSDKGKAFVYACRAYAISRWAPEILRESMITRSEEACKLDPDNVCYKLSYAMLLGRKRRSQGVSLSWEQSHAGILDETKLIKSCLPTGTLDDINLAQCYIAVLNCELVSLLWRKRPLKYQLINQLQRSTVKILDVLREKLKDGSVRYHFFTISKKVAMSYAKCARNKRYEGHCSPNAEEMFQLAISFARESGSLCNIAAYGQVSLEYGKFLMHKKEYERAREILREAWERSMHGECLICYIICCKETSELYNPLNDIDKGLRNLRHSNAKYKVALLCLRADYLMTTCESVKAAVSSLMEALHIDPEGQYMRNVFRDWGTWKKRLDQEGDCHGAEQISEKFVDFTDKLECLLDSQIGTMGEVNDARIHYLRAKGEYFSFKKPPEIEKANVVLQEALSVAKVKGDQGSISEILNQIAALKPSNNQAGQDVTELSTSLLDFNLSNKD